MTGSTSASCQAWSHRPAACTCPTSSTRVARSAIEPAPRVAAHDVLGQQLPLLRAAPACVPGWTRAEASSAAPVYSRGQPGEPVPARAGGLGFAQRRSRAKSRSRSCSRYRIRPGGVDAGDVGECRVRELLQQPLGLVWRLFRGGRPGSTPGSRRRAGPASGRRAARPRRGCHSSARTTRGPRGRRPSAGPAACSLPSRAANQEIVHAGRDTSRAPAMRSASGR